MTLMIIISVVLIGASIASGYIYPTLSEKWVALQGMIIALFGALLYQNSINLNIITTIKEQNSRIFILAVLFYVFFWMLRSLLPKAIATFVLSVFVVIASIGNSIKFSTRNEPFLWSDLTGGWSLIKSVVWDMVIQKQPLLFWTALIVINAIIVLLARRGKDHLKWQLRGIILGLMLLLLIFFMKNTNLLLQQAGAIIYPNNIEANLHTNGPGLYFFFSKEGTLMAEPEDYSKEKMTKIVEELTAKYGEKARQDQQSTDKPTYIYVLSETLADPTLFKTTEWKEDPLPYIRSLQKESGGYMFANVFGGGTANTEYSVLANFSHELLNPGSLPYSYIKENLKRNFSIVESRKKQGYQTLAFHPNKGKNYNRDQVFKALGIDKFYDESNSNELLPNFHEEEGWYSDASFYRAIIASLNEQPQLIHTVSMQNHYPYTVDYKGPLSEADNLLVNKDKLPAGEELATYARGVKKTDTATKAFLEKLQKQKKEIYVVFYGDHYPALSDELYNTTTLSSNKNQNIARQLTPYFIWNNKGKTIRTPEIVNPEFMTLQAAANAQQLTTVFQQFLYDFSQQVNAFDLQTQAAFIANKEISMSDLSPAVKKQLNTYQLLMYDMLTGKQYAADLFKN